MATSYDPPNGKRLRVHVEHDNPGHNNMLTRTESTMFKVKSDGVLEEYSPSLDLDIPDQREVADATSVARKRRKP